MLDHFIYVFGLDTAVFYTDEENSIDTKLIAIKQEKKQLKAETDKIKKNKKNNIIINNITESTEKNADSADIKDRIKEINESIKVLKEQLKTLMQSNKGLVRTARHEKIYNPKGEVSARKKVTLFESTLTRAFGALNKGDCFDIAVVKVYFYEVAESLIKNGFYIDGVKYVYFASSAGQIRTKKLVFCNEEKLQKQMNKLTAGLSVEQINNKGGLNVNKYIAYTALCNTATDRWEGFDIDRCIVVPSFENTVSGQVDYIHDEDYSITRENMQIAFEQTDGVGMILPSVSHKNFMMRMPWCKGLMCVFDFKKFVLEQGSSTKVKDVWGKEWDIIQDDIQIILSQSQLKLWKMYDSWDEYKNNFKKYGCEAGKCNVEEDFIPDSTINYQMIQTLHDLDDSEIKALAQRNIQDINNLTNDKPTMLRLMGVTPWNKYKTSYQKCVEIYNELIQDDYSKAVIRDLRNKLYKDLWSAKFDLGGKFTFVVPDLYAWCEHMFKGESSPQGLLQNGEVSCRLYPSDVEVDCLRSPHLYKEHAVRANRCGRDKCKEWFNTDAVYISCHDYISRILQCDFDGDRLYVTDNPTLVQAAKRNMNEVVSLYYPARKAPAQQITSQSIYDSLIKAFKSSNIGTPSNAITKIWSQDNITEDMQTCIKWLVMEVNQIIDSAKTSYVPIRTPEAEEKITSYTSSKLPRFFLYAKDKTLKQVEPASGCVVDRIEGMYPKKPMRYNTKRFGRFEYRMLMNNENMVYTGSEEQKEIVDRYIETVSNLKFGSYDDEFFYNQYAVYEEAFNSIIEEDDPYEVVDILIAYLFGAKHTAKKKAFWTLFGDIVYNNLKVNISENTGYCSKCYRRYSPKDIRADLCPECFQKLYYVGKCPDCGCDVIIMRKQGGIQNTRCAECYNVYRKEIIRQNRKKYYQKNKN